MFKIYLYFTIVCPPALYSCQSDKHGYASVIKLAGSLDLNRDGKVQYKEYEAIVRKIDSNNMVFRSMDASALPHLEDTEYDDVWLQWVDNFR